MPLPPSSARKHREGPSSASRRVVLASAAGTLANISLYSQPQSARATSRALAFSQLDKAASKEVAAMRQLLRKQQDLLPLMRK